MTYDGYQLWGIDMIWWLVWIVLMHWIFAVPYNIPGQRNRDTSPLDLLKKRFALGQLSKEQFEENKRVLMHDSL